jgi:hypothetical protein
MRWRTLARWGALLLFGLACDRPEELASALGELSVSPEVVEFGSVWVGERVEREVVFRNDGRVPIALSGAGDQGPFDGPSPVTVPAAGETKVPFGFRPTADGDAEGELRYFGEGGRSLVVPVRGRGVPADLEVAEELDFGGVEVGTSRELRLAVENRAPLVVTDLRFGLSGEDAYAFSVVREVRHVPAHGTAEFTLAFAPTVAGPQVAVLDVAACADCARKHVLLRGGGIGADLAATPPSLDFGPVALDRTRTLPLEIRNRGRVVAALREARVEGADFSVDSAPFPVDLGEGGTVTLAVTFGPRGEGARQGHLALVDETGAVLLEVDLEGWGGGPVLVATPAAVDLGRRPLGWQGGVEIALANVGEALPVAEVVEVAVEGDSAWAVSAPSLPAAVGEEGLVFRVDFAAAVLGEAEASLVLVTTSPGQPEVRVPLAARVVEDPFCQIEAVPAAIRFGLVAELARIRQKTVALRNVGTEPCFVWDLRMDPEGAEQFLLFDPPEERDVLPGEEMEVTVSFVSQVYGPESLTSALHYRTSNPTAPEGEVPVSGSSPNMLVRVAPDPLDFGLVPVERVLRRPLEVGLFCSPPPGTLLGVRIAPESDPGFSLITAPECPIDIPPSGLGLVLEFDPEEGREYRGLLEIETDCSAEPLLVPLLGTGDDGPCGNRCDPPVPACPVPGEGLVNHGLVLVGSGIDPSGDELSCEWSVIGSPPGSTARFLPPGACTTHFLPNRVGEYLIRLRTTDPMMNVAECTTTFSARPADNGLRVEASWDVVNGVDLVLLHGGAHDPRDPDSWKPPSPVCSPSDCRGSPTSPPWDNWDLPGTADDPYYEDQNYLGVGPEVLRLDAPTADVPYHVGLEFADMVNGPTRVTTNVFCADLPVATTQTDLTYDDQQVFLGTVQFDSAGACTWTFEGLTVSGPGSP